jgi:tetratricopeptide (TPR) repeat protein
VRHDLEVRGLEDFQAAKQAMDGGDYVRAIGEFNAVLGDEELLEQARFSWVRQHALFMIVKCQAASGNMEQVAAQADRLLTAVPDTFFYGDVVLLKAQALQDRGDAAAAEATFKRLQQDVAGKGLPEKWAREAELGLMVLTKGLAPADKQRRLEGLAEKNKDAFPSVANRARVEVGNAMVEAEQFQDAKSRFAAIADGGQADRSTMAAAWSGLGDCAYNLGLREQDTKKAAVLFEEAALDYLRIAALYPEAFRFVPRALCHAGMSMVRMGKREDAMAIASKLRRNYPNSEWKARLFQDMNLVQ